MESWTTEEGMLGKGCFATNMKWNPDVLVLLGMIFWALIVLVGMILTKYDSHLYFHCAEKSSDVSITFV
jgi:hypothetical protein